MAPKKNQKNWKLSQITWLMVNYKSFNIKEAVRFIGKSEASIYEKKRRLGMLTYPNWNKRQENYLLENGCEATAVLTNKSLNACRIKLSRLRRKK